MGQYLGPRDKVSIVLHPVPLLQRINLFPLFPPPTRRPTAVLASASSLSRPPPPRFVLLSSRVSHFLQSTYGFTGQWCAGRNKVSIIPPHLSDRAGCSAPRGAQVGSASRI